jgi:putative flippase GtrA
MTAAASDVSPANDAPPVVFGEFIRYFACSVLALAVDASLYGLALRVGLHYDVAAVAGFGGGVCTAYLLSVRWAFRRRRMDNAALEFALFLGIGLVGLGLTEALLWLQVDVLRIGPMPAKLVAAIGVFVFNFVARKLCLFVRTGNATVLRGRSPPARPSTAPAGVQTTPVRP